MGQNLASAMPVLDVLAFKYPLDGSTEQESTDFVVNTVKPMMQHGQKLAVWEQDTYTGTKALLNYRADAWIGVTGNSDQFKMLCMLATIVAKFYGATVAIGLETMDVSKLPSMPPHIVGMFEQYQGNGTPILDNTPLEQLMTIGAAAAIPIAGGFGGFSLDTWFGNYKGQGFPGVAAWTIDAYPESNVELLAELPFG